MSIPGITKEELEEPTTNIENYQTIKEKAIDLYEIHKDLECPVCLNIRKNTYAVMECLHRFCHDCIETSLRQGRKECPACRVPIQTRRSLRPDHNFDELIRTLYPNLDEYQKHEDDIIHNINQTHLRTSKAKQRWDMGLKKQNIAEKQRKFQKEREFVKRKWDENAKITLASRKRRNYILSIPEYVSYSIESKYSSEKIYLYSSAKTKVFHVEKYIKAKLNAPDEIHLFLKGIEPETPLSPHVSLLDIMKQWAFPVDPQLIYTNV